MGKRKLVGSSRLFGVENWNKSLYLFFALFSPSFFPLALLSQKSFYILALVGIWVLNPYLNWSGDLKLCELLKIRILKINVYTWQHCILRAGGLQGAMEISAWSALSSVDHLAQGEESTRSGIGQLFLRVAFLIGKSRSAHLWHSRSLGVR